MLDVMLCMSAAPALPGGTAGICLGKGEIRDGGRD